MDDNWYYFMTPNVPFDLEAAPFQFEPIGFVYLIHNLTNGRKYVGKKLLTRSKSFQRKGKKKKKRVESDWRTYTGSNSVLNEDIATGHQIKKTILFFCQSKGELTYYETKTIFDMECLLSDDFYNEWVSCKIRKSHLSHLKRK